MKQEKAYNQTKGTVLILVFIVCVLVLFVSVLNMSKGNLVGRAVYTPIQIYGEVSPGLPDGTEISFKVGHIEIASTILTSNTYGIENKLFFEMDNPSTTKIEGYAKGDVVTVFIEEAEVTEFSYFEDGVNEKNIFIPVRKRTEVTNQAALAAVGRQCVPNWQCEDWGICVDGEQEGICTDINNCGTERGKPSGSRSCTPAPSIEQTIKENGEFYESVILSLFVLIMVGFIISVVRVNRKAKRNKVKKVQQKKTVKKVTKKKR